jgi:hypothetical protein
LGLDNIDCDGRVAVGNNGCYTRSDSKTATNGCEKTIPNFAKKVRKLCWGLSAMAYDACVLVGTQHEHPLSFEHHYVLFVDMLFY